MTCEEIIEIEQYCSEHKVIRKARIAELDISFRNLYRVRMKYWQEDERCETEESVGNFIYL